MSIEPKMPTSSDMEDLVLRALRSFSKPKHRNTVMLTAIDMGRFTRAQREVPPPPRNRGNFSSKLMFMASFALTNLKKKRLAEDVGNGRWKSVD